MAEDKSYITYIVDEDDENATKHYFRDIDLKNEVDNLSDVYDPKGAASTAESNAKNYADGLAKNYDEKGSANQAKSDAIDVSAADATTKADTALNNAKSYADSLAKNYDVAGAASTAENNAKNYADGLAGNYDEKGSANQAKSDAIAVSAADATTKADNALKSAKEYADNIKATILGENNKLIDTYDTLSEIGTWIKESGVESTELTNAIAQESAARVAGDTVVIPLITSHIGNLPTDMTEYNGTIGDLLLKILCQERNGSFSVSAGTATFKFTSSKNSSAATSLTVERGTTVENIKFTHSHANGSTSIGNGTFLNANKETVEAPSLVWGTPVVQSDIASVLIDSTKTYNYSVAYSVSDANLDNIFLGTNLKNFVKDESKDTNKDGKVSLRESGTKTSGTVTASVTISPVDYYYYGTEEISFSDEGKVGDIFKDPQASYNIRNNYTQKTNTNSFNLDVSNLQKIFIAIPGTQNTSYFNEKIYYKDAMQATCYPLKMASSLDNSATCSIKKFYLGGVDSKNSNTNIGNAITTYTMFTISCAKGAFLDGTTLNITL